MEGAQRLSEAHGASEPAARSQNQRSAPDATVGPSRGCVGPGAGAALDGSFGSGGIVTTDLVGWEYAYALAVQPDEKILAAGGSLQGCDDTGDDHDYFHEKVAMTPAMITTTPTSMIAKMRKRALSPVEYLGRSPCESRGP